MSVYTRYVPKHVRYLRRCAIISEHRESRNKPRNLRYTLTLKNLVETSDGVSGLELELESRKAAERRSGLFRLLVGRASGGDGEIIDLEMGGIVPTHWDTSGTGHEATTLQDGDTQCEANYCQTQRSELKRNDKRTANKTNKTNKTNNKRTTKERQTRKEKATELRTIETAAYNCRVFSS